MKCAYLRHKGACIQVSVPCLQSQSAVSFPFRDTTITPQSPLVASTHKPVRVRVSRTHASAKETSAGTCFTTVGRRRDRDTRSFEPQTRRIDLAGVASFGIALGKLFRLHCLGIWFHTQKITSTSSNSEDSSSWESIASALRGMTHLRSFESNVYDDRDVFADGCSERAGKLWADEGLHAMGSGACHASVPLSELIRVMEKSASWWE